MDLKNKILINKRTLVQRHATKDSGSRSPFFIYYFKFWVSTLIRFAVKRQFDYELNIFRLFCSFVISVPRGLIVRVINIIDSVFPPHFGSIQTKTKRIVCHRDISLSMSTSNAGLDNRMAIWKHEALDVLLDYAGKSKIKNINFMEIGAASGIVTLMFAQWSRARKVPFRAICVEPSFANIDFLERVSKNNKFDIRIMPCVVSENERWTAFGDVGTKGFVGDAAAKTADKVYKMSMTLNDILAASFQPNIIYIDAYLNEGQILLQLLESNIKSVFILVEFDFGIPSSIEKKCQNLGFEIVQVDKVHHIIQKKDFG
jgi:FkbM family methyltransferase